LDELLAWYLAKIRAHPNTVGAFQKSAGVKIRRKGQEYQYHYPALHHFFDAPVPYNFFPLFFRVVALHG
jgi:hypothetical protein